MSLASRLFPSSTCHFHPDGTNTGRNLHVHPAHHAPQHCWGRHWGLIWKTTSAASPAPVKTVGAAQQHMKNLICYKVIFPPNTSVHTWRWQKHIWEFAIPHRGYELVSLFCQQAWCLSLVVITEWLVICQAWLFLSQGATWRLSNRRKNLYQALEIIKSHSPWLWKVEGLTSVFSTGWTLRP